MPARMLLQSETKIEPDLRYVPLFAKNIFMQTVNLRFWLRIYTPENSFVLFRAYVRMAYANKWANFPETFVFIGKTKHTTLRGLSNKCKFRKNAYLPLPWAKVDNHPYLGQNAILGEG